MQKILTKFLKKPKDNSEITVEIPESPVTAYRKSMILINFIPHCIIKSIVQESLHFL